MVHHLIPESANGRQPRFERGEYRFDSYFRIHLLESSSIVERPALNGKVVGASPTSPANLCGHGSIVESLVANEETWEHYPLAAPILLPVFGRRDIPLDGVAMLLNVERVISARNLLRGRCQQMHVWLPTKRNGCDSRTPLHLSRW